MVLPELKGGGRASQRACRSPSPSPKRSSRQNQRGIGRGSEGDSGAAAEQQHPAAEVTTTRTPSSHTAHESVLEEEQEHRTLWTIWLGLIVCNLVWYREWNDLIDRLLGIDRIDVAQLSLAAGSQKIDYRPLIMLLPLLGLAYHDLHSSAKKFIFVVPDKTMDYVLRVCGGYGLVQVLAQDLGVHTGANQRNIVQHPLVQFFMLWGGAYALTGHRSEGMVSALLYFVLKLNVSGGHESAVCFEDV
jgi:hypothetical protein